MCMYVYVWLCMPEPMSVEIAVIQNTGVELCVWVAEEWAP